MQGWPVVRTQIYYDNIKGERKGYVIASRDWYNQTYVITRVSYNHARQRVKGEPVFETDEKICLINKHKEIVKELKIRRTEK